MLSDQIANDFGPAPAVDFFHFGYIVGVEVEGDLFERVFTHFLDHSLMNESNARTSSTDNSMDTGSVYPLRLIVRASSSTFFAMLSIDAICLLLTKPNLAVVWAEDDDLM